MIAKRLRPPATLGMTRNHENALIRLSEIGVMRLHAGTGENLVLRGLVRRLRALDKRSNRYVATQGGLEIAQFLRQQRGQP